ncbi:MAG TPA: TonB-dependent receptor [Acidobacteriaceae bacterium]|jgi:hypothetical protein|nr:TonB-dependent receptor [Acidobacteriaceae bacterium]
MKKHHQENISLTDSRSWTFRILLAFAAITAWVWIGSFAAHAQAVYGSIYGTVTDKSNAVIPNSTITVTDVSKGTSVTVQADAAGEYRVQHLIPDTYRVQAEAGGFSKEAVDNVVVYADTAPEVNLQLAVGSVGTTVTVTGGAPLLQTDRADVTTILNERAVENLPNLNRNFTAFELLTPGTTYIGWGPGEGGGNPQRSESIEVDGQLPFATGYELDGTDNQDPLNGVAVINPNLDAVSEMKVTAQNYDAEFGKAVAGLVTAQTRSGSNNFHGTAFEYRRSDAQQARDPFANAPPNNTLAPTLHNQFGGSVGGPVMKDRLFFFVDYQGLREKTGVSTLTTVPTLTAETTCTSGGPCDLSDYLSVGQIYKPNSLNDASNTGRTPFTGNVIPAGDLSAAAVAFFKLLPAPNAGTGVENNYSASGSGAFNTNQPDVRVDWRATEKLHLFSRYTYFQGNLSGAPFFGAAGGLGFGSGDFAGTDAFHYNSLASGGDYVLSAKWLTDFRFGFYTIYNNTTGPNGNQALGNALGIPNANTGNLALDGGLPQFNIDIPANGANGGQNIEYGTSANPTLQQTSQYQIVNNWSHTLGNHNIKFGGAYRFLQDHSLSIASNALRSGTYFFASSRTSGVTGTTQSPGVGFATFLLGDTTTFWRTQTANTSAKSQENLAALYVQDQWRATRDITLDYGLRWELYTPESLTASGAGGLLNLNTGILGIAGVGEFNSAANVKNNDKMFAPRLGVAWQVRPNTVVRAGYGIVYGQGWAGDSFGDVLTASFPTQVEQEVNPVSNSAAVFNLTSTENGVAPGPPGYTFPAIPSNGAYVLPDGIYQIARPTRVRLPTVEGWNLTAQHELTKTLSLQVAYVGSEAYHNMFDSSPSYNANEDTYRGFNQVNPNNMTTMGGSCSGLTLATNPECAYTEAQRAPYYDGTAQMQLGAKYGVPHGWSQRIDYMANQATGSYNALQVILNKRFNNGLQFLTHYTWSHDITHESYQFLVDPRIGRGNGYYNRRQAWVFAGNYDLPFGRQKLIGSNVPGWMNQVIGGFQLNANLTVDGGVPFNTNYQDCNQDNDIAADDNACFLNKVPGKSFGISKGSLDPVLHRVPYLKGSPYVLQPPGQADNTFNAYARPAADSFGNIGRDALWGPGYFNVDSTLAKNFSIFENLKMQLVVEAFNIFNHTNYGNPNSCIDCGDSNNAGYIQGTYSEQDGTSMRRLQFAGRFQF